MGVQVPSFPLRVPPPWWNGRHSGLKIRTLLVQVRQGARVCYLSAEVICPGDGMVDVLDLGSSFWEFKSPPGHFARLVEW